MTQGTLNVWRDGTGTVTEVSFTERDDMGEWQTTVFDCGLEAMTLEWEGASAVVEVRPVVDAAWGRAVEELWFESGWNTVAPYLKGLGFTA